MRTDQLFISDVLRLMLELIDYPEGASHPFLREHLFPRPVYGAKLGHPGTAFHVLWTANQSLCRDYPGFAGIDLGEPRVVGPLETARTILMLAQALNNVLLDSQQQQSLITFGTIRDVKQFGRHESHFEFLLFFVKTIVAAMKGQSFKTALVYKLNNFMRLRTGKGVADPPQLH